MFYLFNCLDQPHSFSPIELSCCPGHRLAACNTTVDWNVIQSINRLVRKVSNITIFNKCIFFGDWKWGTNEAKVCTALFTHSRWCLIFQSCALPKMPHEHSNVSDLQWSCNAHQVTWASDSLKYIVTAYLSHGFYSIFNPQF